MILLVKNNKIVETKRISNIEQEDAFLEANPTYIRAEFNFVESLDLYEYDGTTFNLIANWESIKADREAEILAQVEAERIANLPTFEELQAKMIATLHANYDEAFNAYLAQYPNAEIESFKDKATEAKAYMADNTAPTPYISSMVGGDETLRIEMINAVWAKVQYTAMIEGQMITKRDAIKACTTIEELEAIEI